LARLNEGVGEIAIGAVGALVPGISGAAAVAAVVAGVVPGAAAVSAVVVIRGRAPAGAENRSHHRQGQQNRKKLLHRCIFLSPPERAVVVSVLYLHKYSH